MDVMLSDAGLTLSSREIAELVESRHSDVVRSIERLMQSETIWNGYAPTAYTNPQNRQTCHCYMLNKRDSYVVVAQLSPQFTARPDAVQAGSAWGVEIMSAIGTKGM